MRCNRSQNIYIFLILKYNAASLLSTLTLLQWVKGLQRCFSKCSVCMCVPYQPVSQPDSPGLLWCCGVWLGWGHPDAPQQHSDSTCLTTSAEHPDNTNSSSMIGLFNGSENNALNHKPTHTHTLLFNLSISCTFFLKTVRSNNILSLIRIYIFVTRLLLSHLINLLYPYWKMFYISKYKNNLNWL